MRCCYVIETKEMLTDEAMAALAKEDRQCPNDAAFEIMDANRRDPDNFTHSCEDHVGKMLGSVVGYPETNSWNVHVLE